MDEEVFGLEVCPARVERASTGWLASCSDTPATRIIRNCAAWLLAAPEVWELLNTALLIVPETVGTPPEGREGLCCAVGALIQMILQVTASADFNQIGTGTSWAP